MGKINITFDIDFETKIYSNNSLIGTCGYKDTYEYNSKNDKEILTFKGKGKIAKIAVNGTKNILVCYSNAGQLKAVFQDSDIKKEDIHENNNNNQNKNGFNNIPISSNQKNNLLIFGFVIIAFIIVIILISINSNSEELSLEDNAKETAKGLIINTSERLDKAVYSASNGRHMLGKTVQFKTCDLENEEDGYGRYLMRCKFTFYRKENGVIITSEENIGDVYAIYFKDANNDEYINFGAGGTVNLNYIKERSCWGKSSNLKIKCSN